MTERSLSLEHDPEKCAAVFGKGSCSSKKLERDDDSKKSHPALVTLPEIAPAAQSRSYWTGVRRRLMRDPVTMICAAILLAILLIVIFAPMIVPLDPYKTSMIRRLKPPGMPDFLLGTDELGRDMLARLIYGGRVSLFMGFMPVFVASGIGATLGIIAGYAGGAVNMGIMRVMDVFYAFPSVLLAVAISGALGPGVFNGLFALTLVFIPPITRVAESATTQIRTQDFVEAARASGASATRIVIGHVISNVAGPILIYAAGLISVSIIIAAGLSFLGLGVSPPTAEWGLMLSALHQSIYVAPLNAVMPGAMIFIVSICFNMMSDGLRSAMDVRA